MRKHEGDYKNRSEFIESAVRYYISYLERRERELRDIEIIRTRIEALNAEAEVALEYQAPR